MIRQLLAIFMFSPYFFSCMKAFEKDPAYGKTIITAHQHLKAEKFVLRWEGGVVDILDTSFVFRYTSRYYFNEWVTERYFSSDTIATRKFYTDIFFFSMAAEKDLKNAYDNIFRNESNMPKWRSQLSFQLLVTIKRRVGQDTVLYYHYPLAHPLFN